MIAPAELIQPLVNKPKGLDKQQVSEESVIKPSDEKIGRARQFAQVSLKKSHQGGMKSRKQVPAHMQHDQVTA